MTQTPQTPTTEVTASQNADALVARLLQIVDGSKGKVTFAEALSQVLDGAVKAVEAKAEAPKPVPITEEHRAALAKIADIYGAVAPSKPRLLSKDEQVKIVEERAVIDVVLGLLAKRKDESIRETLANHLDKVAEGAGLTEGADKDARGHYCLKQDEPVEGTSSKISRSVTEPKPRIDDALLQTLWEEGVLTREQYLSVTKTPEVKRTFDEHKARKAMKADPGLLQKIAAATTRAPKTTTIKVSPNK